ncbi:MAG: hypothetical protein MI749_17730 [Desulfovibrionales bacterium]|nr:hypothetical protein [Desulfovibrionales bacterium]
MKKHILVITNSLQDQLHLTLLLSKAGYCPTCCGCANTALITMQETSFDAILADAVIDSQKDEQMAAVEFIALLRSQLPETETPVLVRGEFISIQHMMDTLRSGAARYIPIPCSTEILLDNIASELNMRP